MIYEKNFFFLGDFRMFDWGSFYNFRIYGEEKPPAYKLSQIISPIALFWAENDWLSQKEVNSFFKLMALYFY